MKTFTKVELTLVLEKHLKWLNKEEGGELANLSGADLSCADLRYVILTKANLSGANLMCANLSGADLRYTDLRYANLNGVTLDFSCWPLWCGSLSIRADEKLVGQLAYHLLDLAKSSGVDIISIDQLKELANNSNPVIIHNKEKL